MDLPAALDARMAERLAAVLTGSAGGEDQVAIRDTGTFARRLAHASPDASPVVAGWQPRGTVLVTGGTGGLGGRVARWLAGRGAAHLVLTSRRGTDAPGAAELADELRAHGTEVTVAACDVADREALAALLDGIPAEHPLTGVVHTAGATGTTTLDDLTTTELAETLRAKVDGARHLDELLADADLDAFVLFSSIAGVWGSGGQAAYAAANAYLDALAEQRRAAGRAATSLAWGPWADAGMATAEETAAYLRRRGLGALDPHLAVRALEQAVESGETCVTLADVDWERFAPLFTSTRPSPLLGELPEVRRLVEAAHASAGGPSGAERSAALELVERLNGSSPAERQRVLLELVRNQAASVLGHDGAACRARVDAVQRPRLRLADRRRDPQPADGGDRRVPAAHPRLRLPHAHRPRRVPGDGGLRHRRRGPGRGPRGDADPPGPGRRPALPPSGRRCSGHAA